MPISHNNKLIFIHVPKTGGSSIEKVLNLHPSHVNKSEEEVVLSGGKRQLQHLTLSEIYNLKGEELFGFTIFGMVREPFSRMKSEYKWRKLSNHPIVDGLDLDGFVSKIYNRWIKKEHLDSHFTSQTDFFRNEVQFWADLRIFKFEDGFDKVAEFISQIVGEKIDFIPRTNQTKSFKEKISFSENSRSMMCEMFKSDFELYK